MDAIAYCKSQISFFSTVRLKEGGSKSESVRREVGRGEVGWGQLCSAVIEAIYREPHCRVYHQLELHGAHKEPPSSLHGLQGPQAS